VTRSSSAHSTSSLLAARSSSVVTVAAMRNLAGRRFSATSRYHDSAPRIAGILPNSQLGQVAHELASCLYSPARRCRSQPHFTNYVTLLRQKIATVIRRSALSHRD
jgi:hypothetical protein